MKKWGAALAAILILLMPFTAMKARLDAFEEIRRPEVGVVKTEGRYDPSAAVRTPKAAAAPKRVPEYGTKEQIAALNAGYEEMWEREQVTVPRYAINADERREIERIVASEGVYCGYEFQALVALCILNGSEAENMRPSELFERGDFWLTHDVDPTDTTCKAVSDVFDKGIFPTDEPIRYYYNPDYCTSAAHESMCYVLTCCGCRFFKDRDA